MKRVTLYSNSRKPSPLAREVPAVPAPRAGAAPAQTSPAMPAAKPSRWRRFATRYERPLTAAAGGLVAVVVVLIYLEYRSEDHLYQDVGP